MHIIVKIRLFKWQTIQYFVENLQNIDYHTLNYKIPQILPQYDINLPRALLTRSRKIPCLVVGSMAKEYNVVSGYLPVTTAGWLGISYDFLIMVSICFLVDLLIC